MLRDDVNDNLNDKILVEIASYCDPELLKTVNSAIIQADNKDRVYFGICYQGDDVTDYNELKKYKNCKLVYLSDAQTRGSCYARYLCHGLIEDEKYIYQIDSHMRFVKHWDTKMIENLLSFNDKKAIISFYPPDYTDGMIDAPLDDPIFDNPSSGTVMCGNYFHNEDESDYFLYKGSIIINEDDDKARKRSAFISAANFFSFSDVHKEVKNDPKMFFYGDEIAVSLRLFTNGWNVYNMGVCYIYHQYNRKIKRFASVDNKMDIEKDRFMKLIGIKKDDGELGEFVLGKDRTLKEYEDKFGIDFKNKIVYMNCETGDYYNNILKNKISYYQRRIIDEVSNKKEDLKIEIEVLVVDLFNDYNKCVEVAMKNASNSKRIKFIIGTISNNLEFDNPNIKDIIHFDEGTSYCQILSMLSVKLNDNTNTLIIDSGMRLLSEWDKYLCENLRGCGNSSALTSWVWYTNDDVGYGGLKDCYYNKVKSFKEFSNNLPVFDDNNDIELSKKKHPFLTPFISDGFLFLKSKVLKKIFIDPNLNYEEHKFLYSVRLWTYGINIYYPIMSYVLRVVDEHLLNNGEDHSKIIFALLEKNEVLGKYIEENYPYALGKERSLWTWYDSLTPTYDYEVKDS